MAAVRDALREHGAVDVTMADIAAEADRSTAALHYHYDTKRELLATFLEHLRGRIGDRLEELATAPPPERLHTLVERLLDAPDPEEERLFAALAALRAEAAHVEAYRTELRATERRLREFVVAALEAGVAEGSLTCEDPEATARLLLAATRGARECRVLLDDPAETAAVRAGLETHLLAEVGVTDPAASGADPDGRPADPDTGDREDGA